MKYIISHPTGNQNVRSVLKAFHKKNKLLRFYTTVALFPSFVGRLLTGFPFLKELERRQYDVAIADLTTSFPMREVGRLLSQKLKLRSLIKHESGIFSVDAVYRFLDSRVADILAKGDVKQVGYVYAYEDGALNSFQVAKKRGIQCIYDLPIGYWRSMHRLLDIERSSRPEWISTLTNFRDSQEKLSRKDLEISLADRILVASNFTKKTLSEYPGPLPPIDVIPYGFPATDICKEYTPMAGRKLRLLFVGGLSQRKGIANLFNAIEGLENQIDLTIIGRKNTEDCVPLNEALSKYNWIPSLPHKEVLVKMRAHDVFVFPSLFEGFGLVITEAMSQGTPVITTERTAGPDFIRHGENGWIFPAGDTPGLREILIDLINDPDQIRAIGEKAFKTASERPWDEYGRELVEKLDELTYKSGSNAY